MDLHKSKEKEGLILKAARERFGYYGYAKTTMDEIAGDIGMGKASLYYYFPTKESLFRSVIAREQEEFVTRVAEMLHQEMSSPERLHAYVVLRLDYFQQFITLSKLSSQSFLEIKPALADLMRSFFNRELTFMEQILDGGRRSGEFAVDDVPGSAQMLLHVLQGLRMRTLKTTDHRPDEHQFSELREESRLIVDLLLRGILAMAPITPSNNNHGPSL